MIKHYVECSICGAHGHSKKNCPLYRLNEKQEAISTAKRVLGTSAKSQ